jgi:hypothetical protein
MYGAVWLLMTAMCIIALVRALWAPLDAYRRPSCGGCGHALTDFLEGRCPECGALYAKVGISTPPMAARLRGSLALALLAWTTLSMFGVSYVYRLLEQRALSAYQVAYAAATAPPPPQTRMSETTSWTFAPNAMPPRGEESAENRAAIDYRLTVDTSLITDNNKVESGTGTMELRRNGAPKPSTLTVTYGTGAYMLSDVEGKEIAKGPSVDESVIRAWYLAAALEPDKPVVQVAMSEALKLAAFVATDPRALGTTGTSFNPREFGRLRFNGGGGGGRNYLPNPTPAKPPPARPNGPDARDMYIAGPVVLVIYLAGCWLITWRHRRLIQGGAVPS